MRHAISISIPILLALAACAQLPRKADTVEPPHSVDAATAEPTPLRFSIEAGMNDTWNAVGQILVRTPGVRYDGRAQMLGLYALRYRGEPLMMLTRALPLSDTVSRLTTEVTVTTTQGKPTHSDGAAELLALLARELPTEIESVKARFAAEKEAKAKTKARKKKKSRK